MPDGVEIEILNVVKTAVGPAVWHTTPDQPMTIGSKDAAAKDLKKGDELTFWVAEGSKEMASKPGAKPIVAPKK